MIDEGVQSSTWGNGFVLLLLSYYTVSTKTQRTMCLVTYKLTYILQKVGFISWTTRL